MNFKERLDEFNSVYNDGLNNPKKIRYKYYKTISGNSKRQECKIEKYLNKGSWREKIIFRKAIIKSNLRTQGYYLNGWERRRYLTNQLNKLHN